MKNRDRLFRSKKVIRAPKLNLPRLIGVSGNPGIAVVS